MGRYAIQISWRQDVNAELGFRGYISSRPFDGERAPQHVQNIVIRAYCDRKRLPYLLSATEVAMPDSFLMLEQLLEHIYKVQGIVFYSLLQLPSNSHRRQTMCAKIIETGRSIHFAVEELSIKNKGDLHRIERIMEVKMCLPNCLGVSELKEFYSIPE